MPFDVEPLAYYLNLRRWAREGRIYGLDTFLAAAERLRTATRAQGLMIVLGGAICAALYGVMARGKRLLRATVAGAVFTSGAAGMLGQLTLLFIYQNSYGRLYQTAGALFAVYMLGLAVGSAVSTKYGVYIANRTSALVLLRLPMLITCLLIIPLAVRPSQAALFSLLLTHALLVGVEYPLANRVYRSDLGGVRAVGVLHGMDHLGAAVAASVGGAVVLPLIGPQAMAGALAGVHLVVFVAFAVSFANRRAASCPSSRTAATAR